MEKVTNTTKKEKSNKIKGLQLTIASPEMIKS
jgi:hypothetical protein